MKIEVDDEFFYQLKDAFMIEFLNDDLDTIIKSQNVDWVHTNDRKVNKKLIKAYKRILDYYGANND